MQVPGHYYYRPVAAPAAVVLRHPRLGVVAAVFLVAVVLSANSGNPWKKDPGTETGVMLPRLFSSTARIQRSATPAEEIKQRRVITDGLTRENSTTFSPLVAVLPHMLYDTTHCSCLQLPIDMI